jgi:hypothetical protein
MKWFEAVIRGESIDFIGKPQFWRAVLKREGWPSDKIEEALAQMKLMNALLSNALFSVDW